MKSDLDRPLPHNPDAERCVLGAILLDNAQLKIAAETVHSGDFFLMENQRLFRTMLAMHEAQQPIDLVTLTECLSGAGQLEAAGGAGYIASLVDNVPRVSNVSAYAKIVRETSLLRQAIYTAEEIQQLAFGAREPTAEILARSQNLLTLLTPAAMKVVGGNGRLRYSLVEFLTATFPEREHLVEGLIPRGGSILIFALPHRLKSWFMTALALDSSRPGMALRTLKVEKAVRTLLVQVEDFPGELQWRMRELLRTQTFQGCDPANVSVIPRCNLNLPDEAWYQALLRETQEFKADHVVLDVVRRIFRGDVNSPKDTAAFLEHVDRLREATGCAVSLVHHSNKKDAELMTAAAGSYNFPGWANVVVEFKRKTQEGPVTHVEIEVDNKLAQSPDPMRMVLDLTSQMPVRLEPLEDLLGITEAQERLGQDWTVRDLAEALEVHRTNAHRRLKKWLGSGIVEKLAGGRRGRSGGLARYHFLSESV